MTPILLALLPLVAQEPELLPPGPDGWTFERLEFPLSFARELKYEGFEELWFAPGMFDAAADSHFSYVLAIRLQEDLVVDTAFVRAFLESYYHGLCEAVGADRDPPVDLSDFQVDVEPSASGFLAEIQMVDPFVTRGPMRLRVELDVAAGGPDGGIELFGAASPRPTDAAIWNELHGLRDAWRAARSVPVFLNHVYVVPDLNTYGALRDSEFLRAAFAVSEERTTRRRDTTYTGLYFYGQHTYFEFLQADAAAGFPPGHSGVAFGFEEAGGTQRIASVLKERGIATFTGSITRELEDEQLPWFEIMGVEQASATSTLNLFSLEYVPEFLERWHPDLEPGSPDAPSSNEITRAAVLRRYTASLGRDASQALFVDVTAVHLELDAAELERTLEVCRAFGYAVEQGPEGWSCRGPGIDLLLLPSEAPGRLRAIELSLREPIEREPLTFGKASLTFEGARAVFRF